MISGMFDLVIEIFEVAVVVALVGFLGAVAIGAAVVVALAGCAVFRRGNGVGGWGYGLCLFNGRD
jgi:hypothetical protein